MMKDYFKVNWKTAAFLFLCFVTSGTVFWLYGYPPEPVIYSGILCLLLCLGFYGSGYLRFRKRKELLENILNCLPLELDRLPEPADIHEAYLEEMIRSLNRKRLEAEENRIRSYNEMTDYYTMWVHQIKTPIAALRLLLAEDEQKNRAALGEVFRVEEYVEMVLGYLRTEDISSDMKFSQCSLDTVVREQIHKYAPVFIAKRLSLNFEDTKEQVLTDSKWLGFVIGQCLSNALKYTKTGGIHIYLSESRPHTLVIRDSGTGIRPEDLPRVFEKGFTGHNGREESHSSGIGLYLSRKIMKKLGHEIRVESCQGEGTRVYLGLGRKDAEIY